MRSDSLKLLFWLAAVAWIFLWLLSAAAVGGIFGGTVLQLLLLVGMVGLAPICIYLVLFKAIPLIIKRFKKPVTQG
jgi:hypothetical protein